MTSPDPDLVATGIKETVNRAKDLGLTWTLRQATVSPSPPGQQLQITYDGDTTPINATSLIGFLPVNTRVYAMAVPPSGNFVTGLAINGSARHLGTGAVGLLAVGAGSTTSAATALLPGNPAVSMTKYWNDTSLLFSLSATAFATGGADAGGQFGVRVTAGPILGFELSIARMNINNGTNGVRQQFTGCLGWPGLTATSNGIPAGKYTWAGWWLRSDGAGTLFRDGSDMWSLSVQEYLP